MNDSNFDQHFRDKLGQYRTPVDTDAIWSGVQASLSGRQAGLTGQTSQKPPVWKWVWPLLLLLLLGGLGTGWWMMSSSPSQELTEAVYIPRTMAKSSVFEDERKQTNQVAAIGAGHEEAEREKEKDETKEYAKQTVAKAKEVDREERETESLNQVDQPEGSDNLLDSVNPPSQPIEENAMAAKGIKITEIEEGKDADGKMISDPENTESHRAAEAEELPKIKTVPAVDFTEGVEDEVSENQLSEKPMASDEVAFPISEEEGNVADEVKENESTIVAQADTLDQPTTAIDNNIENLAEPKSELSKSVFIRADFGVGLTSKKLQSLHSDWDQHTMARSTTEKPLEHLGGQFLVGYRLPSGIYAATGVSFTQITERFHVNRDYLETEILENQVSEIHVGQGGDTTFVYTDHQITHHFHEEVLTFNRYTMIDLPVIVGYEWYRNRWYLGLEAGIEFNLSLRTSGRMLAPTDDIIALESSGMFRSNLSLSYLANLRIGYAVSRRFELFLTPGVRIVPQSLLEHDVQHQAYNLYGIRLGTRIWLK